MKVHSFSHVAITVADFNRTVRFYSDLFGAPVVGVNCDHDPERLRTFFGVDGAGGAAPELKIGEVHGRAVLRGRMRLDDGHRRYVAGDGGPLLVGQRGRRAGRQSGRSRRSSASRAGT